MGIYSRYVSKVDVGTTIFSEIRKQWIVSELAVWDILKEIPYLLQREKTVNLYAISTARSFTTCEDYEMMQDKIKYNNSLGLKSKIFKVSIVIDDDEYYFDMEYQRDSEDISLDLDFSLAI